MALVITVEKAMVKKVQPGLWNIIMHVEARDNGLMVIDNDYSVRYRPGDKLADKSPKFVDAIQDDIDKYISEQLIFNNAGLTALTNVVKSKLDLEKSE